MYLFRFFCSFEVRFIELKILIFLILVLHILKIQYLKSVKRTTYICWLTTVKL